MVSEAAPLRRLTRSSLARFAYNAPLQQDKTLTPDIEDIIPPATSSASPTTLTRKRKRTATASPKRVKIEAEQEEAVLALASLAPAKSTTTTTSNPRACKPTNKTSQDLSATPATPPPGWATLYAAAKSMRQPGGAAYPAAVDTMGCARLADPSAPAPVQRFQTLVALMLSSQTRDATTAAAMRRLQTELPGTPPGLTLANMLAVPPETLNGLIHPVGFHNAKTKYLKKTAEVLRDQWKGDIPDSIEGLVSLPGVGPKMGYLCLASAWGRVEGIGVDVHVHRIANLWGWCATRTPEETRAVLQGWLPREYWGEINELLVGLGQTVCAPVGRRCGECVAGLEGLCPAADRGKVEARRRRRGEMNVKSEEVAEVKEEVAVEGVEMGEGKDDEKPSARVTRRKGKGR